MSCVRLFPSSGPRRPQWRNVPERPRLHGLCGLGCAWGASEQNLRVIRTCWGALGEARTNKQIAPKERSGMLASTAWCLCFTRWLVGIGDCDQQRTRPAVCRMQVHEQQFSNTAVARGPYLCRTDGWASGTCQNGKQARLPMGGPCWICWQACNVKTFTTDLKPT